MGFTETATSGSNQNNYTIKEVSERLHVSEYTLRYYEKEGLIPSVKRLENGRRIYSESDMLWIQLVRCLRKTGASISIIKEYNQLTQQGTSTIQQRYELALRQRQILVDQINEFQELLKMIDFKLQYFEQFHQEMALKPLESLET